MKFVADLHLHSKYSRAVSQQMILPEMAKWAKYKGINVLATGDFTHPFWFDHLKTELEDCGNGLFKLKKNRENTGSYQTDGKSTYFILSAEISSIYTQAGKSRRIHNLFFFDNLESVEKFNNKVIEKGANLRSDGRPIVGISARDLVEIAFNCSEKAIVIPAHIWTPWFSMYGSFSGFDSISECFLDMEKNIFAVETGISSDPSVNWTIGDLDKRAIVSCSDSHSLPKMGREATVFEANNISYDAILNALKKDMYGSRGERVAFTIEFYPEEGKYHFTGHRNCNYSQGPEVLNKKCPVCTRELTVGVMDRVSELKTKDLYIRYQTINGVRWAQDPAGSRPAYVSLVPLVEIIAEVLGASVGSIKVNSEYMRMINAFGSEFSVLLTVSLNEIERIFGENMSTAIDRVRNGNIKVKPGFDNQYGVVKILEDKSDLETSDQLNLLI